MTPANSLENINTRAGAREGFSPGRRGVVAKVGNNANSRAPHVHVEAWKGPPSKLGAKTGTPLQIRVDLYAEEQFGSDARSK